MKDQNIHPSISRRGFGREIATLAGAGAIGSSALCLGTSNLVADEGHDRDGGHKHAHKRKGYFGVRHLPFHLQHEFLHAISCNNVVAKAVEVQIGDGHKKQHAVLQRPGTFGWGTITFFLQLDEKLVGQDMTFYSNVGWSAHGGGQGHAEGGRRRTGGAGRSSDGRSHGGRASGEVVFSVEINGDIVVDGGRSTTGAWAEVSRTVRVKSHEMRVTLMVDSIRGNNNFDFWWGEPQLIAGQGQKKGHNHKH